MSIYLTPNAKQRFSDANGLPLVGGKLYTYVAGTTTPIATYTALGGGTNANPIILNANGECDVWITEGLSYKFVLKDSSDVTQWTVDNIALLSADADTFTVKTTTYTATVNDDVILVQTSSAWTLSLFPAAGNSGKKITIKKTSSDFNALTIDANASETIDGSTTTTVNTQYEAIKIICDGTNWHILERKINSSWIAYTPTYTGFGTTTNNDSYYRRTGDSIELSIKFTVGTPTAVEARVSLPSGLTIGTFGSAKYHLAGRTTRDNSGTDFARDYGLIATNGNGYLTFSIISNIGSSGGETAQTGSAFSVNGDDFVSATHSIPVSGWKGN